MMRAMRGGGRQLRVGRARGVDGGREGEVNELAFGLRVWCLVSV